MTFDDLYKELYMKYEVARFDHVSKELKVRDFTTISTWELFDLIEGLKETYAPKIKMTMEQKEELMEFVDSPDDNFETFCFCLGSGDSLFKNKISEYDLMRAWLNPELIEVIFEK